MAPRRVGILTFHRCINYGSYWQARCLVEGLRARGDDAVILDHDSWRINRAEWSSGLRPLLPARAPRTDPLRYALKIVRFSRARASLPRSRRFALDDPTGTEECEVLIVGSDEVWNLTHPWYGGCPLFFGVDIAGPRLVSYGASFGNYDAAEGLEPAWSERLRRFTAISVRDANSRRLIEKALGTEPPIVLDPCLQFPAEPDGEWRGPKDPYVAVYGHSFTREFGSRVRSWARARGYRLVSIGYRNDWADVQWLAAGPHDFAHCIARAEAVATNFFHGCVFALRYTKPFACEALPYRSNKVRGLLAQLRAQAHFISAGTKPEALDAQLSEPPGRELLQQLECLRARSAAYLDEVLA